MAEILALVSDVLELRGTPYDSHSQLVMRLGQRFESARRLSFLPAKPVKTKGLRPEHRGLCQQYVSSRDWPNATSLLSACYEWLQGTAGGLGEFSGINRLTDVPKVR